MTGGPMTGGPLLLCLSLSLAVACGGDPAGRPKAGGGTNETGESRDSGAAASDDSGPAPEDTDTAADSGPPSDTAPPCAEPLAVSVLGAPLLSGASFDLGRTPAQADTLSARLLLTNPCAHDELRFLGHPDDWLSGEGFSLDALPPVYLAPGESAELGLTFVPGDEGLVSGSFVLPYDQPGSPYTLTLSAEVTAPLPIAFFGEGRRVTMTPDYGETWPVDGWETLVAHTNALQRGACAGSAGWLSVGGNDERRLWLSEDALTWAETIDGVGWVADCAWGDGLYVVVGSDALLRSSTDGAAWLSGGSLGGSTLHGVAYGDGVFVAVGADRRAMTEDGLTWTVDLTVADTNLDHVAFGEGVFVAVGAGGRIERSLDGGRSWSATTLGDTEWGAVIWAGDRFLIGDGAEVWSSEDGATWDLENASTVTPIAAVGRLAFGRSGSSLHRSSDGGFTWTEILPDNDGPGFQDAAPSVAP